jgi:hypothetical protein
MLEIIINVIGFLTFGILFLFNVFNICIELYQKRSYKNIIITKENRLSFHVFEAFVLEQLIDNNVLAIYIPFKGHKFIFRNQLDLYELYSTIRLKIIKYDESTQQQE